MKTFYDRIKEFIPPRIVSDVINGEDSYKIDAYEIMQEYSRWQADIINLIEARNDFPDEKKRIIKSIITGMTVPAPIQTQDVSFWNPNGKNPDNLGLKSPVKFECPICQGSGFQGHKHYWNTPIECTHCKGFGEI